jgi:hypothetical protein
METTEQKAEVQDCERCKGSGQVFVGSVENGGVTDCPECGGTGKQPPAEPQGDVVEKLASWAFAGRESALAHFEGRDERLWADLTEGARDGWRTAASNLLPRLTPLLALEIRERLEFRLKIVEELLRHKPIMVEQHVWKSADEEAGYRMALGREADRLLRLLAPLDKEGPDA